MKERSRFTVDMSSDEYMYLKMICEKLAVDVNEFVLNCVSEKIEEIEDEWLAEKASEILKDVESGKEEVVSWEKMKK